MKLALYNDNERVFLAYVYPFDQAPADDLQNVFQEGGEVYLIESTQPLESESWLFAYCDKVFGEASHITLTTTYDKHYAVGKISP